MNRDKLYELYKRNKLLLLTVSLLIFIYIILILLSILLEVNQDVNLKPALKLIHSKQVQWTEIFWHNIGASFLMLSLGILSCGFFSTLILLFNFYVLFLGFSQAYYISNNVFYTIFIISTHGLLEMVSLGIFYYLSTWSIRKLINSIYSYEIVKLESILNIFKHIIIATGILLCASLVEDYITPLIVDFIVI